MLQVALTLRAALEAADDAMRELRAARDAEARSVGGLARCGGRRERWHAREDWACGPLESSGVVAVNGEIDR